MLRLVAGAWVELWPKLTPIVRIHAALAEMKSPIRLWYALRAIDNRGTGKVKTTLKKLSYLMDLSIPTVKRYLQQGEKMGLYRAVIKQWGKEEITIYLQSLFNVCLAHGIEDWGACTDLFTYELKLIRLHATQATAQRLQRCSRHEAKKQHKCVLSAKNLIKPSSCKVKGENERRQIDAMVKRNTRFVFVSEDFVHYGGTQKTIARKHDRVDRTVRRRLSNATRRKKGMPSLKRMQIAKKGAEVSKHESFMELVRMGFRGIFGTRNDQGRIDIWKYCTNVYAEDLKLYSQKKLRQQFRQKLKQLNQSIELSHLPMPIQPEDKNSLSGTAALMPDIISL